MSNELPTNIGAPATRGLLNAGITSLDDLVQWDEGAVAQLHGVGPKVIRLLHERLSDARLTWTNDVGVRAVEIYLTNLAPQQRETLSALRDTLRSLLPYADECMKYGMPAVALDDKGIAGYGAFKDHCGYFPMSGSVLSRAGTAVAKYETTKGGFRFGVDERLPVSLVKKLVKLRIAELGAVENGRRFEYHGDGRLKAVGRMRDGQLHGKWQWFRQDGTLMRTGQFERGEQSGTWTTFDRNGNDSKTTKF